ncbi:DUF3667 domain-containing protein [Sphingobacterium lactis]|uniref:DUF3667 domain-containing protein n=1 Tax=Sphingobacterium lactis TaxID=797291 RepID=UPI003DA2B57D
MPHLQETAECLNCEFNFKGNYCPNCGQSSHEHRIDAHYFLHDIPHSVFHVDKGFFYTLKCLFTRPGVMIKDYLDGKRVPYFRPFAFVLIMTTICSLIIKGIHLWIDKIQPAAHADQLIGHGFLGKYFSVFIFLMIPITSLITWLTFYRNKYNFWEHFLANTYIAAQLNIILLLVNVLNLFIVAFQIQFSKDGVNLFLTLFMVPFLFLFGSIFGFLMMQEKRSRLWVVIAKIIAMNFVLASLYISLMNVFDIINL